jgi:dUTPase
VKVILLNTAPGLTGEDLAGPADDESLRVCLAAGLEARTLRVERGDRIAQLVFARFERPAIEIVSSVPIETTRGEGGFGSTGAG